MEKLLALQRCGDNFVLFWADKISNYWNQLGKQAARAVGRGKLKSRTGTWLPNFPRPCAFSWQSLPVNIWIVAALPYGRRKSANSIGSPAKPSFSFRFSLDHQDLACCSSSTPERCQTSFLFSLTKSKTMLLNNFDPPTHTLVLNMPHTQGMWQLIFPGIFHTKLSRYR